MSYRSLLRTVLVVLFVAAPAVRAQDDDTETTTIEIDRWLAMPPVPVLAPAFADDPGPALERVELPVSDLELRPDDAWRFPGSDEELQWEELTGYPTALGAIGEAPQVRVLAARIHAAGFTGATVRVRSLHRLKVLLNGEELGTKTDLDDFDAESEPGKVEKEVELTTGDHTLLVVAEGAPGRDEAWAVEAAIEVAAADAGDLATSNRTQRRLDFGDVIDLHDPGSTDLSPDGRLLALTVSQPSAHTERRRSWIEFLDPDDGRIVRSLEGIGSLSGFEWAPDDPVDRFGFVSRDDGKAILWVGSVQGGAPEAVLRDVENLGETRWMPDGRSIVFSRSEEGSEDPENFKRYRGLTDRWSGDRDVSSLHQVSVPDGIVRRLTAGDLSTSLQDVAADGATLLFTRNLRDDATWPFRRTELVELDLESLEVEVLATEPWGLGARYDRSGERIAITGPPQAFAGVGLAVDDDVEANFYETQLFLMDRDTKNVRPLSRDFDPQINAVAWVGDRDEILASVTDQSYGRLYTYDVERRSWEQLPTEPEVVASMAISRDGRTVAFTGTGTNTPQAVWAGKLRNWNPDRVRAFDTERLESIRFGKVEDFDVRLGDDTIIGRVYYPPDFDESETYPTIVYYYGGTSPVTRGYGGRYPKEWWAANGYLVYVMQPSGATGFGQEFAARHVNNWGKTVADEIIAATGAYLGAHDFADPDRLGCIGASYGGFMTMLLTTRTDMFAAAVSHAGISSISSYWGEGNWGFAYSAAATAKSYPWNRPDIYVDQSPLFAADEVTTPLLLLHGGIDDNVPPGESEQMYTALRVLGREVEYIRVEGERHWILQYDKRKRWSESIVAWFDRHLKDDAGWWDHLWPADE